MLVVNEKVLWLQVPMKVAVLVAGSDALQAIIRHPLNILLRLGYRVLGEDLVQILLHEFEHEEQVVLLPYDFLQFDYVVVVELAERLDLAKLHRLVPRRELGLHLLDGDDLASILVLGLGDAAKTTVTDSLDRIILFHDIKYNNYRLAFLVISRLIN